VSSRPSFCTHLFAAGHDNPSIPAGARPPADAWMASMSGPLRTMSQEMSEFEFHISPSRAPLFPRLASVSAQR
jgi:hypothetical protein